MDSPGCAELTAREVRNVLAAEVARSERRRAEPQGPGASWFEFEVDSLARLIDSTGSFRAVAYPSELRTAGVTDTVFVRFVVDPTGRVDNETLRVLHARYQASADAVQAAARSWRYHPAVKDGVRVRQLVQANVPVIP
jgi:TonB family protein